MRSTEFPLRTNYELTRILHIYNGSSEIEISNDMHFERIEYSLFESKQLDNLIMDTMNPSHGYKIVKGSSNGVMSRQFVTYAVEDQKAKDLLEWGKNISSPDEWFYF